MSNHNLEKVKEEAKSIQFQRKEKKKVDINKTVKLNHVTFNEQKSKNSEIVYQVHESILKNSQSLLKNKQNIHMSHPIFRNTSQTITTTRTPQIISTNRSHTKQISNNSNSTCFDNEIQLTKLSQCEEYNLCNSCNIY